MHIERIRIDRVFDAQARGAFSFYSGGSVTYGVELPGNIVPRAGAVLVVAFARPGDWSSVLGWRDAAGGKVVLNTPWSRLAWTELDLVWVLAPLLLVLGLVLGGTAGGLAALAAVAGAAGWLVARVWRRNREVRAALGDAAPG